MPEPPWRSVAAVLALLLGLALCPPPAGAAAVLAEGSTLECTVQAVAAEGGSPELLRCGDVLFQRSGGNVVATPAAQASVDLSAEAAKPRKDVAHEAGELPVGSPEWYMTVGQALCCIVCAAVAAGLTLGLTSIEEFELKVKLNTLPEDILPKASPEARAEEIATLQRDQACAQRILPLISKTYFGCAGKVTEDGHHKPHPLDPSNNHYLLVTLLLLNATANEALPLFLDRLVPAWAAILMSVTVVLVFGEIIPSAVFTGPNQLPLAAALSPLVRGAKLVFLPVVWPISLILDKCLGTHAGNGFSKAQIKGVVRALRAQGNEILVDEANMIHGVLEMHYKAAKDIAKPLDVCKMVPHDTVLDRRLMQTLDSWGHSRVLVHRGNTRGDIRELMLIKKLVTVDDNIGIRMDQAKHCLRKPVVIAPDMNLLETLNKFQESASHLAVLSEDPAAVEEVWKNGTPIPEAAQPTMFMSLEDVIECLLKEDIFDEEDKDMGRDKMGAGQANIEQSVFRLERRPSGRRLTRGASRLNSQPSKLGRAKSCGWEEKKESGSISNFREPLLP